MKEKKKVAIRRYKLPKPVLFCTYLIKNPKLKVQLNQKKLVLEKSLKVASQNKKNRLKKVLIEYHHEFLIFRTFGKTNITTNKNKQKKSSAVVQIVERLNILIQ
ncbi:MAG: hypothetical protein ACTSX6_13885 [Candidatus Heimdallarchaeaceae archaeon]